MELADTMDLGSIGQPCRFKSCYPHHAAPRKCAVVCDFRGLLYNGDKVVRILGGEKRTKTGGAFAPPAEVLLFVYGRENARDQRISLAA